MGFLTTHILDTAQGKPAAGIPCELYYIGSKSELISSMTSNADGRTDKPILDQAEFTQGEWELVFRVADYFRASGLATDEPPFLDRISLRFSIAKDDHYHVPLLVSPWSYSTYRGS